MNTYVASTTIKHLREIRNFTQADLADRVGVSSKTISKWETAKGLPDISLLQPLAQALGISVIELMNGEHIINKNVSANMLQ
jgi:transcriptional regulator with XRE-family HTH domain